MTEQYRRYFCSGCKRKTMHVLTGVIGKDAKSTCKFCGHTTTSTLKR